MKKILLIAPPYNELYGNADIRRRKWGFVPYGLASIAGALRGEGHQVKLVDVTCLLEDPNDINKIIASERWDYLCIGFTTPQFSVSMKICQTVKKIVPDCVVIAGGPHVSALPEEALSNKDIDIAVVGEGEITVPKIVGGAPLESVQGIAYRKNGAIVKTGLAEPIEDLDSLPFPLYEQLPIEKYGTPYMGQSIGIVTGRGCPYGCTFCASKAVFGKIYRFRSVSSILNEIEWFMKHYGISSFSFWDDTFTVKKDRVEELCGAIIDRKLDIKWSCTTRLDVVSSELLKLMKKAGCSVIHLGIESGDEFVLEKTKKGVTLEQARDAVGMAKDAGIETYGYFMLGLPYDTKETIEKTIGFAKELKLDYAQFSLLTPLPGTEVWQMAKEGKVLKLITDDYSRLSRYGRAAIELPGLTAAELDRCYKRAYREFYLRPGYIMQTLKKINSPQAFIKYLKMALGFLGFIS